MSVVDIEENKNGLFAEILYKNGKQQWELVSVAMRDTCSKS